MSSSSCAISKLNINSGDKIVLILIVGQNEEKSYDMPLYTYDEYKPFAFPIFGTAEEYGSVVDVERDENVKYLESYFKMPIDEIVKMATMPMKSPIDRDMSHYFMEHPEWLNEEEVKTEDLLKIIGYKEIGQNEFGAILESDYAVFKSVGEYDVCVEYKDKEYAEKKFGILFPYVQKMQRCSLNHWMLNIHQKMTGEYIGLNETAKKNRIGKMAGMFILREVYDSLMDKEHIKKTMSAQTAIITKFKNDYEKIMSVLNQDSVANKDKIKKYNDDLPMFLYFSNQLLNWFDQDLFMNIYGQKALFDSDYAARKIAEMDELIHGMIYTNTMFAPTMQGSDYEGEETALKVHELACEIMRKRIQIQKEWDEE